MFLSTLDLIKGKLALAYSRIDERLISEDIISIMEMSHATCNAHMLWFERLLGKRFYEIIAHAAYIISVAKSKVSITRLRLFTNRDMAIRMMNTSF